MARRKGEKSIPLHVHPQKRWHILSAVASLIDIDTKESCSVVLEHKKIVIPSLPYSFEGFRIVHLSDLHIRDISKKEKVVLSFLQGVTADLTVITGDFTYGYGTYEDPALYYMAEVRKALQSACRIVGVRGNSDSPVLMERLREVGIEILTNECFELTRANDSIYIGGVDDPHHHLDDVQKTFDSAPKAAFKILFAHSPDVLLNMEDGAVDLLLCGHTHGGQVNFPYFGPLITKTRIGRKFARGLLYQRGMGIHVSRGIGGVGLRYQCPPEIAVLELARG